MHEWHGAGHLGGMWLWWVLAIAGVVMVGWALVRSTSRPGGGVEESAEEVLKRRYAKGEIDKDDYEKRLRDLRQ